VDESSPLGNLDEKYDFTMCNPPFFKNDRESESMEKSRKLGRSLPSAAKTGRSNELVTEGGEVQFISQLIQESIKFPNKVK